MCDSFADARGVASVFMSAADPVNVSAATCQLDTKLLSSVTTSGEDPLNDPLIGREVIGQYRIEKKLGTGGMGAVYLAQQTSVQRPAVIKVLRGQLDDKLDLAARFAIEAKAASNLNHPNIVTIYNYGAMDDGTLFIAMEYLEGETLEQRIARCGTLPADRAVHVAAQIARALGEAHARGVVHRDLKPANVMLVARAGEPDFVKVLDFGIAKLEDSGVTSAGYVVGTPRYMSPEQLLGKPIDGRSDVYSAGVVLYEMLAGVTPFSAETPIGWVHQHVTVAPKPPSELAKGDRGSKVPPAVDRAVLRALAKAPADRPSTMEDLVRDLEAALRAPLPPPWWKRSSRALALRLVACLLTLGAGFRRFFRAVGSGAWRSAGAVVRGTWSFVRAIGRGVRGLVRAVGSAALQLVRAVGFGVRRLWRALGSATRRFVLAPPARLGRAVMRGVRAMFATKRRRFVVFVLVVGLAGSFAAALPNTVNRLFEGATPKVGKTNDSKKKPAKRTSPRAPDRDKKR